MEEYLKLLFGDKFDKSSFDFDKAVEYVGVPYKKYLYSLRGDNQLKTDIDEDKMYYFMLFNCYNLFAYPIKVVYSPSLYVWLKAKYSPSDFLEIDFESKCSGKKVTSKFKKSDSYGKMMHNCIIEAIKSLRISDFSKQGKIDCKVVNAKDYLFKAHTRDYISILIYRLSKLLILLALQKANIHQEIVNFNFSYKNVSKEQRKDILKIIKAFGLWSDMANNNDFSKVISDSSLSGEMLDRDKVYLSNGKDTVFYTLPDDIIDELLKKE
jgi:hypothetical protein